ncbi:MAG: transcriptional regulator, TraR/DksA family [Microgenomates group bacterium Gr01-1014_93]|nr:MAG: transcriptional regulator, TraR/DksA family [Microgenomates group bacterium Gr01-1014_93]
MLSLPQKTFNKIKNLLLKQQKELETDLVSIQKDDPVSETYVAQASEPGTDSWMAEMHGRALTLKQNMQDLLLKTKNSLANLRSGKYGKCIKCGKQIEIERLEAMLTATLCLACSKKFKK